MGPVVRTWTAIGAGLELARFAWVVRRAPRYRRWRRETALGGRPLPNREALTREAVDYGRWLARMRRASR